MTREEALNILHNSSVYHPMYLDALNMAIKALEQEPCEDAISRQYLVEKAVSWDKHFADGIRYVALTDILNAPPVTPQPKMGRWEKVTAENRDGSILWWYACSECGAPCPKTDYGTDYFGSYCSECGSRIQEEE